MRQNYYAEQEYNIKSRLVMAFATWKGGQLNLGRESTIPTCQLHGMACAFRGRNATRERVKPHLYPASFLARYLLTVYIAVSHQGSSGISAANWRVELNCTLEIFTGG